MIKIILWIIKYKCKTSCIAQSSPEKQKICIYIYTYIYKEIYYKKLAHAIMKTESPKIYSWQVRDPGDQ